MQSLGVLPHLLRPLLCDLNSAAPSSLGPVPKMSFFFLPTFPSTWFSPGLKTSLDLRTHQSLLCHIPLRTDNSLHLCPRRFDVYLPAGSQASLGLGLDLPSSGVQQQPLAS